jgi:K+-sensing histidine kinase KdpD
MVDDLLVIPDIEGAKLNLSISDVNLEETLNNAVLSTKYNAKRETVINIPEDFPCVKADTDRLEQVFINLFENAYKYSYEDSQIVVNVEKKKKNAIIEITNSYDYIPNDKIQKLFGKFVRIEDQTTRTTRGTGLGLFIVKGLVLAMNGSIELKSTNDNKFSVVIKLPLA